MSMVPTGFGRIHGGKEASRPAINPVARDTMHERAYAELRRLLICGAVRPGMEMSLRGLAQQLGTSEMPVREAVRRLIAENALQSLPSRKVIVPHVNAAQFRELLLIRTLLEMEATRQACATMGSVELRQLRALQARMLAVGQDEDGAYLTLNQEFHFTIYRACGLPLLLAMIEKLWLRIGPIFTHIPVRAAGKRANDHHRQVLDALGRRDEAAAAAAIGADLADVGAKILAVLTQAEAPSHEMQS